MTRAILVRLVPALGLTQIISWGSLYYSIAVLGASMRGELGLSAAELFGAYSLSLLLSAVAAPIVGRAIDRHGGRRVMSIGSVTAAVSLLAIAHAQSATALYAAWALAGVAMAMTMYDAAFATLSRHAGDLVPDCAHGAYADGRPGEHGVLALVAKGPRVARVAGNDERIRAAAHCDLLAAASRVRAQDRDTDGRRQNGRDGRARFPGARIAPTGIHCSRCRVSRLNGFIVSALTVHLIALLQGKGLSLESAVWVGAFFGPMQVAGRILEFTVGRRFSSRHIGAIALWLLVGALAILIAVHGQVALALVFAVVFGCSNGVVTIVRGTVPAELFGRTGYGGILGSLAAPALFARAIAPFALAPLAMPETASSGWLALLMAMAVLSVVGFNIAVKRR